MSDTRVPIEALSEAACDQRTGHMTVKLDGRIAAVRHKVPGQDLSGPDLEQSPDLGQCKLQAQA